MKVQVSDTQLFEMGNIQCSGNENNYENNYENTKASNSKSEYEPLIESWRKADKELSASNTSVQYSIHEETKDLIIKIVNNNTKEVIREIPSEKILDMFADMCKRNGIFVDNIA
ncbi:flagellar protein FlaG [Clostridium sp. CX1]|uniref:flagellar protein FlaG n=1 Tax=Clostridium sp. CX1 TaxID=2978346 RepID=UPI0021BE1221|nr:flagellar protein FlaG [Clostridium sp. CX1]MCT8976692.1 flagellar protein FlaG [Clostridium sp. CX1]